MQRPIDWKEETGFEVVPVGHKKEKGGVIMIPSHCRNTRERGNVTFKGITPQQKKFTSLRTKRIMKESTKEKGIYH